MLEVTETVPNFARLPWVRPLREPAPCAAKVVSHRGCRNRARWSYTFLRSKGDPADVYDGQTVTFCTTHLLRNAVQYERRETVRCRRWFDEHR
jgi:hypothetical protein